MGFAGATADRQLIFLGGVAALVGGALSMASGEYVSVSSQRDTERALIHKETRELADEPDEELAELAELYRARGLSDDLARQVALELTEKDALRAHLDIELGIDPDELTSPWQAAVASMLAFTVGGLLPLLTILLFPHGFRAVVTIAAVTAALGLTGYLSARVGEAPFRPADGPQRRRRAAGDGRHLRDRLVHRRRGRLSLAPWRPGSRTGPGCPLWSRSR